MENINELKQMLGITNRADVVNLSPSQAKEILKRNTNNRKLSSKTVSNLQKQMINGEFKLSNDAITFDSNGVLTNGQHRLTALALSEGKVESVPFLFGFDVQQFMGMDTGRRRTVQDNYTLMEKGGLSDPKYSICLRIAQGACCWCNGEYNHKYISQEEYKNIINYLQNDLLDCYNNGLFSKSGSVTPIAVMIAMFLAYLNGVDMSVLKHIYTVLNTGIIENVEDRCIIKLRDKILTMKGNGRIQTATRITYTMDCISKVSRKSAAEQIRQGKFIYTYKKMPYVGIEWKK